jgi:hypothetical protein
MCRLLHYGFRLGMIMVVVAFVSLVLASAPPQIGPYTSALSTLAMGAAAHAAPPACAQAKCGIGVCLHTICCDNLGQATKCKFTGKGCSTASC